MLADMVADMVADIVADMEVDKVADMAADMVARRPLFFHNFGLKLKQPFTKRLSAICS